MNAQLIFKKPISHWQADSRLYNLSHSWPMSMAMDLALLCLICKGENGISECCWDVFTVDIALSHHFVAPHPPSARNKDQKLISHYFEDKVFHRLWLLSHWKCVIQEIWPTVIFSTALPPCRSASGNDYASEKLSKMMGNLASYSFNSWCVESVDR